MADKNIPTFRADRTDDWFNYNLRIARINAGYTVDMLAEKAGVNKSSIYVYERLKSMPSPEIAERIASALNKDLTFLFPEDFRQFVADANKERKRGEEEKETEFESIEYLNIEEESPEEIAMKKETPEVVDRLLDNLKLRDREILRLRYGIGHGYNYTLEEVGRIFKITRERVRQIENKAIEKLRQLCFDTERFSRAG